MIVRIDDRRPFFATLIALIALAWLSLWMWERSPSGHFLRHHSAPAVAPADTPSQSMDEAMHSLAGHDHTGMAGHEHAAASGHSGVTLPLAIAGWTLMTAAMMLPTTLPLLGLFHAITRRRPDRPLLVALLIAGYLAVWALFGVVAHAADLQVHTVVERTGWLASHDWLIAALIVIVAGLYQFTPLKYHCLDRCRSPLGFIMGSWRGGRERLQALRIGIHHGVFCVGCCWSLMLLMFAVGVGSLAWMLLLGAVMAAEKNLPWGRRLSAPLGIVLLGLGGVLTAHGLYA